jgi:hypothetical protein
MHRPYQSQAAAAAESRPARNPRRPLIVPNPNLKLLQQLQEVMRIICEQPYVPA